jgi:hypothetical protein
MWGRPRPLVWQWPPGEDDDEIRRENWAAGGNLRGWDSIEVRWTARRGWPSAEGWWLLAIPGFFVFASVWGAIAHPGSSHLSEYFLVAIIATVIGLAIVEVIPALHEPETAAWTLRMSLDSISLEKAARGSAVGRASISRLEAGELVVDIKARQGRYGPSLRVAAGRSIDGTTEVVLRGRSVSTGGFLGHFWRVPTARALVSWWPVNSRSVDARLLIDESGLSYWNSASLGERPGVAGR